MATILEMDEQLRTLREERGLLMALVAHLSKRAPAAYAFRSEANGTPPRLHVVVSNPFDGKPVHLEWEYDAEFEQLFAWLPALDPITEPLSPEAQRAAISRTILQG